MALVQYKMNSVIGALFFVTSDKGLRGIFWKRQTASMLDTLSGPSIEVRHLNQAVREISEYLAGQRTKFEVSLDVQGGTTFQTQVWTELSRIPYGKTLSYKELAAKLETRACRAVGTANARNPLSIIVPCHRVIATGGGLGGYAGGLSLKKRLLDLERSTSAVHWL